MGITQYTMAAIASIPTVRATAAPKVAVRRTSVRAAASGLRTQFGSSTKAFAPLGVTAPKARGNLQVVAGVTKKPDLSDPVLRAKLAKGMAQRPPLHLPGCDLRYHRALHRPRGH